MKKKLFSMVLFFVLIFILFGIVILGYFIYEEFFEETTEPSVYKIDKIYTEEPDIERNIVKANESISELISGDIKKEVPRDEYIQYTNQNLINSFFYNQLNDNQKKIYDGLMQNKQYLKQGDYVINFKNAFADTLSQENGADILGDDYQSAIEAFTHDNLDVFYLDVNKMYLNIETSTKFFKTTYNVYISAAKDSNYLSNEFQSKEKIESASLMLENEKNKVLNRLKGTDYQNILYIHDYLVDNLDYDSTYNQIGSYTIYGALVEKKCVCEGYAKAFKYLANCAGYECELMQGKATNNSGQTENHAWNCIKLNDKWYEVDVTWDDPIIIGGNGRTNNNIKYRYFLKGTNTFNKDHVLEYQFSDNGKKFLYPNLNANDY